MGIYRCHHCKHIQEHIYHRSLKNLGQCAKCKHDIHVYDTVYFVEQIINRYTAAMREIESLKNQLDDTETSDEQADNQTLTKLSIHDTNQLATQKQHQPLMNWFEKNKLL